MIQSDVMRVPSILLYERSDARSSIFITIQIHPSPAILTQPTSILPSPAQHLFNMHVVAISHTLSMSNATFNATVVGNLLSEIDREKMMDFSFLNEESYPSLSDLKYLLLCTALFPVLRLILDRYVYEVRS